MNFLKLQGWRFIRSSVPSPVYIITVLSIISLFYLFKESKGVVSPAVVAPSYNQVNQVRQNGYELIKPLLFTESASKDPDLQALHAELSQMISRFQNEGKTTAVSVYLRQFSSLNPIVINDAERYQPGSLLKLPVLITYLKNAETNPALLNRKLLLSAHFKTNKGLFFTNESLKENQAYTIKELLYFMMAESSNDAVLLLLADMNFGDLQNLFRDLQLPVPESIDAFITSTASEYSRFLRVLYNATYLSREMSEYALTLMTKCNFNQGMTRNTPADLRVAHKFGESGNVSTPQLHEAGIIYYNNNPYLLVVMTKGTEFKVLSNVVSEISDYVLNHLKSDNQPF